MLDFFFFYVVKWIGLQKYKILQRVVIDLRSLKLCKEMNKYQKYDLYKKFLDSLWEIKNLLIDFMPLLLICLSSKVMCTLRVFEGKR